jgi:drug/metabolite transporter (DMT)-like permease
VNRKAAIALLVLANVLWGSSFVVAKVALAEVPPPLLVQPLVGALLELAVLRDPLTAALVAGATLIFTALYLMTVPERTSMVEEPLPGTPHTAES